MREWQSQAHVRWYCRSHIIIVPKYRKKAIFGSLRKQIGKILREICEQGGIEVVEGHGMVDHVHLCLSIPPKDRVATAVGRMKGKSAIRIHREFLGRAQNFTGFAEQQVLEYIREQEEHEKVEEQLVLQLTQKHTK